jgi:hypothetical protein
MLEACPDLGAALRAGLPRAGGLPAPAPVPPRPTARPSHHALLIGLIGGGVAFGLLAVVAVGIVVAALIWKAKSDQPERDGGRRLRIPGGSGAVHGAGRAGAEEARRARPPGDAAGSL